MKDINECRERLRGIFNITVTPFDASGAIDYPALRENIERVIGLGYDGLLIGGTYGEFPVMTVEERRELFHEVMACVDDRVAVMLCSASSDPRDARELTVLASELGGLPMVTAPFVSEITDEQIISYFNEMAPLSKTGILVYNAPGIGITLSPTLLERLARSRMWSASNRAISTPPPSTRLPTACAGVCACSAPPIWLSSDR